LITWIAVTGFLTFLVLSGFSMSESAPIKAILACYFGENQPERLVGAERKDCSDYNNIVRFFGEDGIDPASIRLMHANSRFEFDDPVIASFAAGYEMELRSEGRLKDGPDVTRLAGMGSRTGLDSITIQRATYGQFAGSCFCLDRQDDLFGESVNLRKYYLATRKSTDSEDHPLAACFGISGLVLLEEENQSFILRVRRSARLATMTGTYGASVAGVVDYDDGHQTLWEMMQSSLAQEIQEEINLRQNEYRILPLAYAHELYRGEHPQLFCLVLCSLTRRELSARLTKVADEHKEFDRFDFLPISGGAITDPGVIEQFNFEGRMSFYLAEEFLQIS
jgi:8-oxo-dGTP pyrophosphatase MutT (NUDIX family)